MTIELMEMDAGAEKAFRLPSGTVSLRVYRVDEGDRGTSYVSVCQETISLTQGEEREFTVTVDG